MDFISPLPSEISSAVPSAFWSYRCERGKRGISTGDFFLKIGLLRNYAQVFILQRRFIQILEYCVS